MRELNFQKRVYKIVKKIPKGSFLTYKGVARRVGSSRAWRAVGNVLNKNPEGLRSFSEKGGACGAGKNPKIPCHRVIRSDGKIGGYNKGVKQKISLLRKEGIIIKHGKIASRFRK